MTRAKTPSKPPGAARGYSVGAVIDGLYVQAPPGIRPPVGWQPRPGVARRLAAADDREHWLRAGRRRRRRIRLAFGGLAVAAVLLVMAGAAHADTTGPAGVLAAPKDLTTVINNLRNWLVGIAFALATCVLAVGGIRYVLAGGDPSEVNKAKEAIKWGCVGYGVAVLSNLLVEILKNQIIGA